jgi:hypothetical protein
LKVPEEIAPFTEDPKEFVETVRKEIGDAFMIQDKAAPKTPLPLRTLVFNTGGCMRSGASAFARKISMGTNIPTVSQSSGDRRPVSAIPENHRNRSLRVLGSRPELDECQCWAETFQMSSGLSLINQLVTNIHGYCRYK